MRTIILEGKEQYEAHKRENGLEGIEVLAGALTHKGGMTGLCYDQHLIERMDAGDNLKFFFLVDESDEGKIVAAAMGWPFGTIQNGPRLHIQSLAVVVGQRGKGLGIAILKEVQQYCLENNRFKGFDLDVGTQSLIANSERYLAYGAAPTKTLFSIEARQTIGRPKPEEIKRQDDSVNAIVQALVSSVTLFGNGKARASYERQDFQLTGTYTATTFRTKEDMYKCYHLAKILNSELDKGDYEASVDRMLEQSNYVQHVVLYDGKPVSMLATHDIFLMKVAPKRACKIANAATDPRHRKGQVTAMLMASVLDYYEDEDKGYGSIEFCSSKGSMGDSLYKASGFDCSESNAWRQYLPRARM